MCLARPMRVIRVQGWQADCADDHVQRTVDIALIDALEPGDWVLVDRQTAIRRVDETEARRVQQALAAVAAAQAGEVPAGAFADLEGPPELPPHLQPEAEGEGST